MDCASEMPLGAPEESSDIDIESQFQDPKENYESLTKNITPKEAGSPPINLQPTEKSEISEISQPASTYSNHTDLAKNARKPIYPHTNSSFSPTSSTGGGVLPESVEAKMRAFHLSRQITQSRPLMSMPSSAGPGLPNSSNFRSPAIGRFPADIRPPPYNTASTPVIPKMPGKGSLGQRRGISFAGGLPGTSENSNTNTKTSSDVDDQSCIQHPPSIFNQFSEYVDTKNGTLKFAGKAVVHGHGIDFTSGNKFRISLDEVDTLEELGKGNYGTVYKVRHARPRMRRPGLGLAGYKIPCQSSTSDIKRDNLSPDSIHKNSGSLTGVVMAMKEIRLELDEAKFAAIIMELDILHRCNSPYIIDFYGAFFQEGAVYICIEFMDGGSVDKLYGNGIPENVLRKIAYATVQGLKTLKDEHNIIHRDVKPTNILVNTRGQIKICDFGVSGNLVASIAKTNIGCQSYMAPERISGGGIAQSGSGVSGTYSVQSDIWSLGLSIIECAMGRYPYPPETYNNIFSQLSVSFVSSLDIYF